MNLSLFNILFILGLSLIPTLIMLGLILYSDRKSKEPLLLITVCIFSGFFTITLALFIQNFLMNSIKFLDTSEIFSIYSGLKIFLLSAAEEYCKLLVLYLFISHTKSFDDIYDGFVYSAIIALSFAGIETVMYVFKEVTFKDMSSLALVRSFTSIPLHLVCGIIMGYYIALEKFSKKKRYKILELSKSLAIPIIIHASYNMILTFLPIYIKNNNLIQLSIVLFIISIYTIGFIFVQKNINLNEKFIKNKKYPDKYQFLMNKKEFNRKIKKKTKKKATNKLTKKEPNKTLDKTNKKKQDKTSIKVSNKKADKDSIKSNKR